MNENRLQKQLQFLLEIDKLKSIYRKTYLVDGSRYENVAEHTWHLTLMAIILFEYTKAETNTLKVIKMALIHDLVEIYSGDSFAFGKYNMQQIKEKESCAAKKIFSLLPSNQGAEFLLLWKEFEAKETPEAIYANSIDRLQPLINDCYCTNKSNLEVIKQGEILKRMEIARDSIPKLWEYINSLIQDNYIMD